jgi:hypothetical protein
LEILYADNIRTIGVIKNQRNSAIDDNWGAIISEIELAPNIPTKLQLY